MILRNKKGRERNFKILFKIEHNDKTYIIYEDYITGKCYAGLKKEKFLNKISEDEETFINKILERVIIE